MEPSPAPQPAIVEQKKNFFLRVTLLSRLLALALFIALPFIGGYVGYVYAPEKVVEIEKMVPVPPAKELENDSRIAQTDVAVVSASDDGVRTLIKLFQGHEWKYDGEYYVYDRGTESSSALGHLAVFEWMPNGYRYKPLPVDQALFNCENSAAGEVLLQTCEPNIDEIEWVTVEGDVVKNQGDKIVTPVSVIPQSTSGTKQITLKQPLVLSGTVTSYSKDQVAIVLDVESLALLPDEVPRPRDAQKTVVFRGQPAVQLTPLAAQDRVQFSISLYTYGEDVPDSGILSTLKKI